MTNKTEDIWNGCSRSLRMFIARRVSNPDYVDDILQEVFVKIHSKIDTLKDDTKLCSWVFQVARNTIIDYYRKHKPNLIDIDTIHLADDADGEAPVNYLSQDLNMNILSDELKEENTHQEIASTLKEVVESLPEKYARALILVEFEGLSQKELADKLNISISGAKSRVQRGRQMLKDSLMNCCHFEFDKYGTIIDAYPHCCCCCDS